MPSRALTVLAVLLTALLAAPAAHAIVPARADQWYLDSVGAAAARAVTDGAGATVAVIDSGVDATHPDLAGHVVAGPDLVDGSGAGRDENGHGTAIAGLIGGRPGASGGVEGLAPGATLLSIRDLDARNTGTTQTEAAAIDAAVARGAQVIALAQAPDSSVGSRLVDDPLVAAVDRASDAGVAVVAAAGNQGLPLCAQPLAARGVLCVGALAADGGRASYSNFGARVDLMAPGGDGTTMPTGIVSTEPGGGYGVRSGTSQATALAAGAAALLASVGVRGQDAVARLRATARDGALDAGAALAGHASVTASDVSAAPVATALVTARARRSVSRAALRRQGLRVRCRTAKAGRCRARLTVGGVAIARGARTLRGGQAATLTLRLIEPGGRRRLARVRTGTIARLTVTGPDGAHRVLLVTIT